MPARQPGSVHNAIATKEVVHGAPCTEDGFVGIAHKTAQPPQGATATDAVTIEVGEEFSIVLDGAVTVANGISIVKGSPVYIVAATNALTLTVGSNLKFGRATSVDATLGTAKVNLNARDSF